jgi:hypothetical protein
MATQVQQAATRMAFPDLVKAAAKEYRLCADCGVRPTVDGSGRAWQLVGLARKLSPKGFVVESLAAARSTPERIKTLRALLDGDPTAFPASLKFLGRTRSDITNLYSPGVQQPVTGPGNSLVARWSRDLPGLGAELAQHGFSLMELLVIAAEDATRLRPEAFGKWDSLADRDRYLEDVRLRLDGLLSLLATSYTPADLTDTVESKGSPPVTTFAITHGAVALAPKYDMPERLARWASTQPALLEP